MDYSQYIDVTKTYIIDQLDKLLLQTINESQPSHNHPPVRFLVDDCKFCQTRGNIFCLKT